MEHYLTIALAGFVSVFMLGFNSRNVNAGNYRWAIGSSLAIGLSQAYTWRAVTSDTGFAGALVYAAFGGAGVVSAMYVHQRFIKKATVT